MDPTAEFVVVFDGVCGLCNASVDFIVKRDRRARFRFAARQSTPGEKLLRAYEIEGEDTLALIERGRAYTRSTAVLRIARGLRFPWPLLAVFVVVPRPLRDGLYRFVASRRYRWFGVRATCRVPSAEERGRFVDSERATSPGGAPEDAPNG